MNVYYCKTFKGHYPVGTSAVIVAETDEDAWVMLDRELIASGLRGLTEKDELVQLNLRREYVTILNNGDY